jgi:hypothetical protein
LLGLDGKLINQWFLCQDLLKIDPKNLIKELENTETFDVERILDKEVLKDGQVKYLVKWYSYSDKDNSWESPQKSFKAAIKEYKAAQKEVSSVSTPVSTLIVTVSTPVSIPVSTSKRAKKTVPKLHQYSQRCPCPGSSS